MKGARRLFEFIALGGCAFILSGAMAVIMEPGVPIEGNPTWRLVLAIGYLGVAVVLLPWYREILIVLRRNWSLVALVFLAMLSSLWAEKPDLVFRKGIGLFGTTLFGIALAVRFSFQDQLRILSWLFRLTAILSLGCVVLLPSYGISSYGEWQGVFAYKNAMGSIMGLSLLVEWQLPATNGLSKVLKGLAMFLYAFLLLKADSVTPAVTLVATMILLNIYKFAALRLRVPLYAVFLIIAILASVGFSLVVANSDSVMGAVGRSSNLTGRTEIWNLAISFIQQRPILGYGYSGFWLGASSESIIATRIMRGYAVYYSHNGYLEMLLTLGAIGLLLTLLLVGTGMNRALIFSEQRESGSHLWPLAFLIYFISYNSVECIILTQNLEWGMCVSCIVGAGPGLFSFNVEQEDELPLVPMEELG